MTDRNGSISNNVTRTVIKGTGSHFPNCEHGVPPLQLSPITTGDQDRLSCDAHGVRASRANDNGICLAKDGGRHCPSAFLCVTTKTGPSCVLACATTIKLVEPVHLSRLRCSAQASGQAWHQGATCTKNASVVTAQSFAAAILMNPSSPQCADHSFLTIQ